jgi:hypothetical protein
VAYWSTNVTPAANDLVACSVEDCAEAVATATLANIVDNVIPTLFMIRRASARDCGQPLEMIASVMRACKELLATSAIPSLVILRSEATKDLLLEMPGARC